jgi:hypothetical protein
MEAILVVVNSKAGADAFFGKDEAVSTLTDMASSSQPDIRDVARRLAERVSTLESAQAQQAGTPRVSLQGLREHIIATLRRQEG